MKANRLRASAGLIALAAAAGSPAHAGEEPSVTWLWEVTTDDGDALVEPGETATVTLSADMEPSVGEPGQTDGFMVTGLAITIFDTLGGLNADRGGIVDWQVLNLLDFMLGDQTTTDGISLFGTVAAQGAAFDTFTSDDPVDVLSFSWQTQDFTGYSVHYSTDTLDFQIGESDQAFDIDDSFFAETIFEAQIQFQVVPSPSNIPVMFLLLSLFHHRRRDPFPERS